MTTERAMIGTFKNCCPTLSDNDYHISGFHLGEDLLFELDWAECTVCDCKHDIKRCPYIHPLNRAENKLPKFKGPSCAWCHGKHLGIDCPDRNEMY